MVVKTLLIVSVTTLNFSIVPRRSRSENMMTDMISLAKHIKKMNAFCFGDVSKFAPRSRFGFLWEHTPTKQLLS